MGRMIDADKLVYEDVECTDGNTYMVVHAPMVDAQPTAYDVDKVVKQLEDYGNEECAYYENTPYKNVIVECVGKAIEIVKGGTIQKEQEGTQDDIDLSI